MTDGEANQIAETRRVGEGVTRRPEAPRARGRWDPVVLRIPGIRSRTLWKRIAAAAGYVVGLLATAALIVDAVVTPDSGWEWDTIVVLYVFLFPMAPLIGEGIKRSQGMRTLWFNNRVLFPDAYVDIPEASLPAPLPRLLRRAYDRRERILFVGGLRLTPLTLGTEAEVVSTADHYFRLRGIRRRSVTGSRREFSLVRGSGWLITIPAMLITIFPFLLLPQLLLTGLFGRSDVVRRSKSTVYPDRLDPAEAAPLVPVLRDAFEHEVSFSAARSRLLGMVGDTRDPVELVNRVAQAVFGSRVPEASQIFSIDDVGERMSACLHYLTVQTRTRTRSQAPTPPPQIAPPLASPAAGAQHEVSGPGPGRPMTSPTDDDLTGARIRSYTVVERLGAGGFGSVYRVHHDDLGLDRALKVLHRSIAADATQRERFLREARTTASLRDPHIVPVYDVFEERGLLCIVMELITPALTLAEDLRRRHGPLPPPELVRVSREIGEALDAAHAQGVVHRDVKPQNILLTLPAGRAMLGDFGISRTTQDTGMTETGISLGTPTYMSPEQLRGGVVGAPSDNYSLALVLFEAATGRKPYGNGNDAVAGHLGHKPLPRASQLNPALPPAVDATFARGLAHDPAARYPSAGDLATALAQALGQ